MVLRSAETGVRAEETPGTPQMDGVGAATQLAVYGGGTPASCIELVRHAGSVRTWP